MWDGFRWWQGMDVDLSTKEIIPNKSISRTSINILQDGFCFGIIILVEAIHINS